ncbi:uncharacterized protein LOC143431484 [Xylocopa sonorina]|uniref:uncharacterized protein LOC143431484 n=1 Tax=Xylocopa sonorina TaxID=1818115 RepID=UPI00403B29FB
MGKQMPKMSARVVNAIKNLRGAHGSTSKEIMKYITTQCNVPETTVQRQMQAALKRGLDYGILTKSNGHYFLRTEPRMASSLAPIERTRRRRRSRGRSKRRRSARRRRRRSRRRSRGRRRRPRRRRSRRSRRRSRAVRKMSCTRCRCSKRARNAQLLSESPVQRVQDDAYTCEFEGDAENRRSKSRSRSSANSDHDDTIDDRRMHYWKFLKRSLEARDEMQLELLWIELQSSLWYVDNRTRDVCE